MDVDVAAVRAFVAVAQAGGFREAARVSDLSASSLSDSVKRLETRLGVRLLHRTTRSVSTTEAGAHLLTRLGPAMAELDAALDVANDYRATPSGTLRLNVPVNAARLVLPGILPPFLAAYPAIHVEVVVESRIVDIVSGGYDAGIRYDDRLEKDMIAVPIGPRQQRFATAAAPSYLERFGTPTHPRELLDHACIAGRFDSGALAAWEFEHAGDVVRIMPSGPLTVTATVMDLALDTAIAGAGVVHLFEDWVQPSLTSGELVPVLKPWWQRFTGPFLYYPGKGRTPAPLRLFVEYIKRYRS